MRFLSLLIVLILAACSSSETSEPLDNGDVVTENNPMPEDNIESYTGGLWRTNSIEFEIQLARDLNALDVGPFLDYNRRFSAAILPANIIAFIESLDVSLAPNEFPLCGLVPNTHPENYIVRVTDSNGDVRIYMDETACNLGVSAGLPRPDQIIGILVQAQMHELRNMLLEFDPRLLNP